jgi:hypothetical protein
MKGLIWLQNPTVFGIGGGTISLLLNVLGGNDVRRTELHTTEPLVPESSAFGFQLANGKLKSHKSPSNDRILAELIKATGRKICPEIHKCIISMCNKDEFTEEWKESIIVPI